MNIRIYKTAFNPWEELQKYQQHLRPGSYGGTCAFVGTMRDFNQGDIVQGMYLEHYPGMTEKQLSSVIDDAKAQWDIIDGLILHRVGELSPDQPIVLTAVWSAHRKEAFEACRFLMETLKTRATFWKREQLKDNTTRWVDKNSPGY